DDLFTGDVEDAEVDPGGARCGGDRQRRAGADVRGEQLPEVQVGEDVAVEHEKVLGQQLLEAEEWTDRREWNAFLGVVDAHPPPRSVADDRPDEMTEVVDRECGGGEP